MSVGAFPLRICYHLRTAVCVNTERRPAAAEGFMRRVREKRDEGGNLASGRSCLGLEGLGERRQEHRPSSRAPPGGQHATLHVWGGRGPTTSWRSVMGTETTSWRSVMGTETTSWRSVLETTKCSRRGRELGGGGGGGGGGAGGGGGGGALPWSWARQEDSSRARRAARLIRLFIFIFISWDQKLMKLPEE
ncbi:hypothetical protein EYF80_050701 [Liparis tanakae]|uniref:Uncharacterized protein n=1 Tax=Liparis tanakae TaxID=230148 RepID=A0A4Z2FD64_9TELE|nr:hypothetical protein EYF80_050701 [Liparis tanakae]